jgi:hypothetical protein
MRFETWIINLEQTLNSSISNRALQVEAVIQSQEFTVGTSNVG